MVGKDGSAELRRELRDQAAEIEEAPRLVALDGDHDRGYRGPLVRGLRRGVLGAGADVRNVGRSAGLTRVMEIGLTLVVQIDNIGGAGP